MSSIRYLCEDEGVSRFQLTRHIVTYNRGSRDIGVENFEAGHGGEIGLKERTVGKRNEGEGIPNLHRCGDGSSCREITSKLKLGANHHRHQ